MHSIVLEQVGVNYGGRALFTGIDLTVPSGACTAVVGPSGVGKTTLLRLLNRLAEPSTGRILLDGVPLAELDVLALRRRVGLVPQHPVLLADVVVDEVRVGRPALWDEQVGALLNRVGLPESFVHRRCAELSGGEAQRICLARALAVAPEVLLLDEPTSALDEAAAAVLADLIRAHCRSGGSAVLVSHDSEFTGTVADDILLLENGRLAPLGTMSEMPLAPSKSTPDAAYQSPGTEPGDAEAACTEVRRTEPGGAEAARTEIRGAEAARTEIRRAEVERTEIRRAEVAGAEDRGVSVPGGEGAGAPVPGASVPGAEPGGAEVRRAEAARTEAARAEAARAEVAGAEDWGVSVPGGEGAGAAVPGVSAPGAANGPNPAVPGGGGAGASGGRAPWWRDGPAPDTSGGVSPDVPGGATRDASGGASADGPGGESPDASRG
ncbi:ABC transporter ATP-binding protein [Nocardia wallacei]|uniref:ABC transporter ATP-binding protein n=1 Tax=Nocardia wallacei TaxID=480035 RepID=UPI002454C98C|nr:ATP-binding cassette domain-containing protein [Nocardia wallacei]